jgi:hypothetical protein
MQRELISCDPTLSIGRLCSSAIRGQPDPRPLSDVAVGAEAPSDCPGVPSLMALGRPRGGRAFLGGTAPRSADHVALPISVMLGGSSIAVNDKSRARLARWTRGGIIHYPSLHTTRFVPPPPLRPTRFSVVRQTRLRTPHATSRRTPLAQRGSSLHRGAFHPPFASFLVFDFADLLSFASACSFPRFCSRA